MAAKNEEPTSRDVPRFNSTLEDVDYAMYNFVDDSLNVHTTTNKGFKKVPVIWSGAERAHNIKNHEIERSENGTIILPVISIERTAVRKDLDKRTIPYAQVDPRSDLKGGYLTINKVIKQDKTSNFANADANRLRDQLNFPIYRNSENGKIVYETLTVPLPIYVDVSYEVSLRTEYQEQMNDLLTPFIRSSNAHRRILISHNSNQYEAFYEDDVSFENNISSYETDERKYESKFTINVLAYLIGDGKNQIRPRVVRRENAVQIRFARESVVVDGEDGEFRF